MTRSDRKVVTPKGRPEALDSPTSMRLARQARSNTGPEVELRRVLWGLGLRYRLHQRIPSTRRTVDIAITRGKVAVFVDGCFWHACPKHGSIPKNNFDWWEEKLRRNTQRDRDTDRRLVELGWAVVRVWEHEDIEAAAQRIEAVVQSRRN